MTFRCRTCREPIARDPEGNWAHMDDEVIVRGDCSIRIVGGSWTHAPEPDVIDATCTDEVLTRPAESSYIPVSMR